MDIKEYLSDPNEKPLDVIRSDGGFTGIFRTIACVGDSLSSGEFEAIDKEGKKSFHDMYEYSWGQYIARMTGSKVYNFSRSGMTAREYCESFADSRGLWSGEKKCQCYIMALGVNDISNCRDQNLGALEDICLDDWKQNKKTFVGYYAQIIQRLRQNQPDAKFFLMTIPRVSGNKYDGLREVHAELLYRLADLFEQTYVLDFRKYAPVYDETFKKNFYLNGHMNAAGYLLTARMVASYIDYIIRNHPEAFAQVGYIGTPYYDRALQ